MSSRRQNTKKFGQWPTTGFMTSYADCKSYRPRMHLVCTSYASSKAARMRCLTATAILTRRDIRHSPAEGPGRSQDTSHLLTKPVSCSATDLSSPYQGMELSSICKPALPEKKGVEKESFIAWHETSRPTSSAVNVCVFIYEIESVRQAQRFSLLIGSPASDRHIYRSFVKGSRRLFGWSYNGTISTSHTINSS